MNLFTSKNFFIFLLFVQSSVGENVCFAPRSYQVLDTNGPIRELRGVAHRVLNGWSPCGTNTHCVTDRATCAVDANGMGTCTCLAGYGGVECRPVNECETDFPCPGGSVCVDMFPPDRFKCVCKDGFTPFLPNELPDEPMVPLEYRPVSCIDIVECANTENPPCHPNATCTNTIGSFECVCNGDLEGNGITTCAEPPEIETTTNVQCSTGTDCQGSNMQCVNATCTCLPGYAQVGPNCQNEVHCDVGGFNNDCHRRATCIEEDGFPGFSCNCTEGWEDAFEDANGKSCVDVQPVTEAPPPTVVETTTLPEGVGPHPNRPTVFPPNVPPNVPQCLANMVECEDNGIPCCEGFSCTPLELRRRLDEAEEEEITIEEAYRVLHSIRHGNPYGYFEVKDNIISETSIQVLKEEADDAYANDDFDNSKLPKWRLEGNLPAEAQLNQNISGKMLVELIGKDEAALLLEFFCKAHGENTPVTNITLQVSHNDEMSYFPPHTDHVSAMIVFLGQEEFERGGVGYYDKDGYTLIPAAKGKAIAHGPSTVHQSEPFEGLRHILAMASLEGNDCILKKHLL